MAKRIKVGVDSNLVRFRLKGHVQIYYCDQITWKLYELEQHLEEVYGVPEGDLKRLGEIHREIAIDDHLMDQEP